MTIARIFFAGGLSAFLIGCDQKPEDPAAGGGGGGAPAGNTQPNDNTVESLLLGYWMPDVERTTEERAKDRDRGPLAPHVADMMRTMTVEFQPGELLMHTDQGTIEMAWEATFADSDTNTMIIDVLQKGNPEPMETTILLDGDRLTMQDVTGTTLLDRTDAEGFKARQAVANPGK